MRHNAPRRLSAWFHEIDVASIPSRGAGTRPHVKRSGWACPLLRCGDRHAGRMVASVLTATGMDDWIAHSREEYCTLARKAAHDIEA